MLGALFSILSGALILPQIAGNLGKEETRYTDHIDRGKAHFDQQQYNAAAIEFKNAINLNSTAAEAYYRLGLVYFEQEQHIESFQALNRSAQLDTSLTDAHIRLGKYYVAFGQMGLARAAADMVVRQTPQQPEGYLLKARIEAGEGRSEAAFNEIRTALLRDPKGLNTLLLAGTILETVGKTQAAEHALQQAVDYHEKLTSPYLSLATFYQSKGRDAEAEQVLLQGLGKVETTVEIRTALAEFYQSKSAFQRAENALLNGTEEEPDNSLMHVALGDFHLARLQPDVARKHYQKAFEMDGESLPARKRLAQLQLLDFNLAAADSIIQDLAASHPEDTDVLYLQGKTRFYQQDYVAAATLLGRVIARQAAFEPRWRPNDLEYLLARAYQNTDRLFEGRAMLARVSKKNPYYYPARLLIAEYSILLDDEAQALQALKEIIDIQPDNLRAGFLLGQLKLDFGSALSEEEGLEQTIRVLRKVLEKRPDDLRLSLLMGRSLQQTGKNKEAEKILKEAAARHDTSVTAQLSLANFYHNAGDTRQVEQVLKKAKARFADSIPVQASLAWHYLFSGDFAAAEAMYQGVLQQIPEHTEAYIAVGDFRMYQGKADSAIAYYQKALVLTPEHAVAQKRLAYMLFQLQHDAQADSLIRQIRQDHPKDPGGHYLAGRLALAQEKPAAAVEAFKQLPADYKFDVMTRIRPLAYYQALAFHQSGQPDKAQQAIQRVPQDWLNVPNIMILDAEIRIALGEEEDALKVLRVLQRADPDNLPVYLLTGLAFLQKDQLSSALTAYQQAVDVAPDSLSGYYGMAQVYVRQNKLDEAFRVYEQILAKQPHATAALDLMAGLLIYTKQSDKAFARLDKQLQRLPDSAAMHELKAKWLEHSGLLSRAEQSYRRAVDLGPDRSSAHFGLAKIQYRLGDRAAAMRHYRRVMELDPQHYLAANNLAWLYLETGEDLQQAWRLAEMAHMHAPDDPNILDTLGWVYYHSESYERASNLLAKAVERAPEDPLLFYHLGMTQSKQGDVLAAYKSLARALELDPNFSEAEQAREFIAAWDRQ